MFLVIDGENDTKRFIVVVVKGLLKMAGGVGIYFFIIYLLFVLKGF
jgi:hypothetical protein